jgi:hypothetical protein
MVLRGRVASQPAVNGREILFQLQIGDGRMLPCRAAEGYEGVAPALGAFVMVEGDVLRDLITGEDSYDFFFTRLSAAG